MSQDPIPSNHSTSEPTPPMRSRFLFWMLSITFLTAMVAIGCYAYFRDPIIPPRPEIVRYQASEEQRERLSPNVRMLLEKIEAHEVSGKHESEFAEVLAEDILAFDDGRCRRYHFFVDELPYWDPHLQGHPPEIFISVQKRTGIIVFCAVGRIQDSK